jgi:multiple sugar transport system substrate-binding protein
MNEPDESRNTASLTRRRFFQVGSLVAAGAALAACSSNNNNAASSTAPQTSAGSSSAAGSSTPASSSASGSATGGSSVASSTASSAMSSASGSGSAAPGTTVDITYWSSSSQDVITYLDSNFNKAHPGIKVTGQYITSADNTSAKVVAALKSGTEPNVLLGQDPAQLPLFAESGKVVDLSSSLKDVTDMLYPGIKSALFYQNKQLGLALGGVGNYLLFYNKDHFSDAGISGPPKTWDELETVAAKLTDPAKKRYGIYIPLGSSEWISYTWEAVLWANGGELMNADNSKVAFNSKAGQDALTTWYNLVVKDKSAPSTSYAQGGSFDGAAAFASGAVSMIIEGQWALSEFSKINYGVALMPAGTSGKSAANIGIGVAAVFDKGQDANTAAQTFVDWLGQPEQGAYLTAQSGGLPSAPNQLQQQAVKDQIAKQPTYQVFAEQLNYGHTRPTIPAYAAISQALSDNINKCLTGKATPQEALSAAESAGNAAIANAGG